MTDAAVAPRELNSRISACTPDPPVPSLPVIVSIVCFMAAKEQKRYDTTKHYSHNDKKNCNLYKKLCSRQVRTMLLLTKTYAFIDQNLCFFVFSKIVSVLSKQNQYTF